MRITIAVLITFIAVWILFSTVGEGQCGAEDALECTPMGWVLLTAQMLLGAMLIFLGVLAISMWLVRTLKRCGDSLG